MTENAQAPRNARIEALRLVAILGIAVFHTFQPWFSAATVDAWDVWVTSPGTLATLGCVNLLGSYGNHVFFLISGFFLVPRAAARSGEPGYWREQARAAARRSVAILLTVALYVLGALAIDAWVVPIEGISLESPLWIFSWLEFIWVYLVIVLATPLIGWAWGRVRRPIAVVCALAACVFAVNAYIAFVSPGDEVRDLLEWRKLMSAASYLVAFLVGGALAERRLPRPGVALACCSALAVGAEAAAALAGNTNLLVALSFKSTSPSPSRSPPARSPSPPRAPTIACPRACPRSSAGSPPPSSASTSLRRFSPRSGAPSAGTSASRRSITARRPFSPRASPGASSFSPPFSPSTSL